MNEPSTAPNGHRTVRHYVGANPPPPRPRPRRFLVCGTLVDPTRSEERLRQIPIVEDVALTPTMHNGDRHLAAYVVLKDGRLLKHCEKELRQWAMKLNLRLVERPVAWAQVPRLPYNPKTGQIDRARLGRGGFRPGKKFCLVTGKARFHKMKIKPMRNPINEVRFEGIVAIPIENRRYNDPEGKFRAGEAYVTVSQMKPHGPAYRAKFKCLGELAREARTLEVGTRVCITGEVGRWRQFVASKIVIVEPGTRDRLPERTTDAMIGALL